MQGHSTSEIAESELQSPIVEERQATPEPSLRKLDEASEFIDQILQADVSASAKQRHMGRRVFNRLNAEFRTSAEVNEAFRGTGT